MYQQVNTQLLDMKQQISRLLRPLGRHKVKHIPVATSAGQTFHIRIPKPARIDSFIVFGLMRSGSTLLMKVLRELCRENRVPVINVESYLWRHGLTKSEVQFDVEKVFRARGYGYLGQRSFPIFLKGDSLDEFKKLILVRDPRDALVC